MLNLFVYSRSKQFFLYEHIINNNNCIVFNDGSKVVLPQAVVDVFKKHLFYIFVNEQTLTEDIRKAFGSFYNKACCNAIVGSFYNSCKSNTALDNICLQDSRTAREMTRLLYASIMNIDEVPLKTLSLGLKAVYDIMVSASSFDNFMKSMKNERFMCGIIDQYVHVLYMYILNNNFHTFCIAFNPTKAQYIIDAIMPKSYPNKKALRKIYLNVLAHPEVYYGSPNYLYKEYNDIGGMSVIQIKTIS